MITSSNSLCRERDAQSNRRCSTSHHGAYRAVPRTNRTLMMANSHSHSATSNTNEPPCVFPSPPWQCFCADAWARCMYRCYLGRLHQQEAQQRIALFADVTQSLFASTGFLTRNHAHVRADLLAALKPSRSSDDQHIGECRKRPHTRMSHQSQNLGSLFGFPLGGCG